MAIARLDGSKILDWASFHDASARELGFPSFYGRNLDAWIDCLSYLDEGDGMSRFTLAPGEVLDLEVLASDDLKRRAPNIFGAVVDCARFVNKRYVERGKQPLVRLVLK